MTLRHRRRRIYQAHVERLSAELHVRLATRRAARAEHSRRSRKGASTRVRQAFLRDRLVNEMVPF